MNRVHEAEYRRVLGEEDYTGWLHIVSVERCPGGYTWSICSDRYQDGAVARRSRMAAYEGYRAPEEDMAQAQAAVALEAILESRGGEVLYSL